jgi:hypothetical protein
METRNPRRREHAEEMGNRHRDVRHSGDARGGLLEQQQQQ